MNAASSFRAVALALIGAALACQPARVAAQMNMSGHAMETRDEVAPSDLPVPQRIPGIGNVHMQITASPEAQAWFDQGLNLYHDFWYYESERAFEQAIRVDPSCAICYWGLYKAEAVNSSSPHSYARQALDSAVRLKKNAGKPERMYIEASAAAEQIAKDGDRSASRALEARMLRKLVQKYPRDTQARIFLMDVVQDGYDDKGEPRAGQKEALSILQGVLKGEPDNSAANHYYIHALEAGNHPEQALHSAEILSSLAPSSGHMGHMPGHIFYRVGDYARAEQSFTASMEVDERYMREQHVKPDDDWNYVHNMMYAIANLMEEGKLAEATALSSHLSGARGELEHTLYIYAPRDGMSRIDPRLPVALRTANWPDILEWSKAASVPANFPNLRFLAQALADFAAGMQATEARDFSNAESSSARLDAALWRMSHLPKETSEMDSMGEKKAPPVPERKVEVMPDAVLQPLLSSVSIMSLELRASLLTAKQQTGEASKLFTQAAREEKELGYREPPIYIRPVGETEAAARMSVNDWAGARAAYQRALVERPRSGFPLYGLAICSEKAGDSAAAAKEYAEFLSAWQSADPALAEMTHAREFVAQHPVVAENGTQK